MKADIVHKPSTATGAYDFSDYRGTKSTAASGAPCLTWDRTELSSDLASLAGHGILGKHFFCRKPPSKSSLGCYTSHSTWESCIVDASQEEISGLVATFDSTGSRHVFRVNVKTAGTYDIRVTVNGQPIGQELILRVGASSATVQNSVVISRGMENAIAGTESSITVFAVDAHGNVLEGGASAMEASVLPNMRNATSGSVVDGVSVANQQDGSYRVAFTPKTLHSTFDRVKRKFVYDLRLSMASDTQVVRDLIYISAGAADAGLSSVDGASIPQSMVAATAFSFDVSVRDKFGNVIDDTRSHAVICDGVAAQHFARSTFGPYTPKMRLVAEQVTGSYSHSCTLDGTQFDTVRYEVTEAAFSAADSFMDAIQSSVVAGSTLDLSVSLRDVFGNAYSSAAVGSVSFRVTRMASSSSTMTSTARSANAGRDRYVGAATLTVAGQYRISALMAGATLIDSATIVVIPAAATAATSVASGAGLTAGTAGEEASFAITAKDEYGNLRPTSSTKDPFTCTVVTPQNNASAKCAISFDGVAQGYVGRYTPKAAGTYILSVFIYGNSVPLLSAPQLVVVAPATADATNSIVEGPGLSGGVAGSAQYVIVHGIDAHGNEVPGSSVSFVLEISGPQSSVDRRSMVVSCAFQSNNLHRCDFTVTEVGIYDLTVKLDQAVVTQASPIFTASTFDASQCEIRGLSSTGTIGMQAGSSFTFLVDIKDSFGNLRSGDGDHVVATSTSAKHANLVTVHNYGNGTHAVTLSSTIADVYTTLVELYGVEIPASPISTVVTHAEPSAMRSRVYGSGVENAVAGSTATFYVQLQDRFGNVATSSTSADIGVSFAGPGAAYDVSVAASSTATGTFVYEYKMRVSGQYTPTVKVRGASVSLVGFAMLDVVPAAVSGTTSALTTATPIGGESSAAVFLFVLPAHRSHYLYNPPPALFPCFSGAIAGNMVSFVVQTRDLYGNMVTSHKVAASSFAANVECHSGYCATLASVPACSQSSAYAGDGKYQLSISCDAAGSYTVTVKYSGVAVANGQWVESIVSTRASGAASLVTGSGVEGCTAGSQCRFTATIFDSLGNPRHSGGDNVQCSLTGPDATATTCKQVSAVGENYTFAYTTPLAGTYTPAVSVEGEPIPLPSSTIVVMPAASNAESSQFFGQGIFRGVAGQQQNATVVLRTCLLLIFEKTKRRRSTPSVHFL